MSTDEVELAIVRVIEELIKLKRGNKQVAKGNKKMWVKTWILKRNQLGVSNTLLRELALEDHQSYSNFLRINEDMFNILLQKVIIVHSLKLSIIIYTWGFIA